MADAVTGKGRSAYELRFALAYGLVALVFGGVIVLFAFLVSHNPPGDWSSYKPKGGDVFTKAQNMADHVAPAYKINGQPIAVVQAQPLLYQDTVVEGIAFTRQPFRKIGSPFKQFEPVGSTVAYVFCGTASRCGVPPVGAETMDPMLRRETLELALYTFKYVPGIESIVAFLPPKPGSNPTYTLFLRKSDLSKELKRPLHQTLTRLSAPTPTTTDPKETPVIDRLTLPSLFQYSLTQSQDGSAILVLDPLALNG
jgi:hypothetical protein